MSAATTNTPADIGIAAARYDAQRAREVETPIATAEAFQYVGDASAAEAGAVFERSPRHPAFIFARQIARGRSLDALELGGRAADSLFRLEICEPTERDAVTAGVVTTDAHIARGRALNAEATR